MTSNGLDTLKEVEQFVYREARAGGSWTPASCMGDKLIRRLETSAGMSFELQENR